MKVEFKNGTAYLGDCLEIMPTLEQKFDLVLTDPPYGICEAKGKNKSRGVFAVSKDYGYLNWDDKIPCKEIFDLMFEISNNQIIFGGNYFVEYLKNSPCWIVWDKDNGNTDFADSELAWTSFKSAVRNFKWKWQGMLQQDMKNKEERFHPTQKPIGLFSLILNKYSEVNQTIFDPFGGSGTTALACIKTNRRFVVIEKEPAYFDIICKRIKEEEAQLKLF
jgi:site-specific DNA-methyltransferase (adenine-specific)